MHQWGGEPGGGQDRFQGGGVVLGLGKESDRGAGSGDDTGERTRFPAGGKDVLQLGCEFQGCGLQVIVEQVRE